MKKIVILLWDFLEQTIRFVIAKIFRFKISEEGWNKLFQFIKFGIVGLSNTVVSYVIYVISLWSFQKYCLLPQVDYLVAQFIGFAISVLWSFYWNRKYVFNAEGEQVPWPQALLKTYISYAFTGIFLNSILAILWVQILEIPKLIAPIINLLISVPINFLMNKFWAFKGKRSGKKKK